MGRLSDPSAIIEFGRFSILPHRRQLLAEGRPIGLGGRAFDLLLTLIEAPGAVVGKDELLSRIWPGRMIQTVAGRGYQFELE
jgi:DNA-binding winged helix-turn-helix (wHTH) protein